MPTKLPKVSIVGTVGLPANYGGFETLVDQTVEPLSKDFDVHVYCSSKRFEEKLSTFKSASLHYIPLDANGAQSILYDVVSMIHAMRSSDVIVVLGVSGCLFLPVLRRISRAKVVTNIDGLEWRRDKWGRFARWLLRKSESVAVRHSDIVIADNKCIAEYVHQTYGIEPECVAYGGDHATRVEPTDAHRSRFPFLNEAYAVKVCRIEPENNVHVVLESFEKQAQMPLVLVGNWKASEYGRRLFDRYSKSNMLTLSDPIYEPDAINCIRSNAALYVHGHSAGGTNPSLVEAMSLGLPVLAFDVEYNRATTESGAAYFDSVESLSELLRSMDAEQLAENRNKMGEIASRRYKWSVIAEQYRQILLLDS